MKNMTIWALLEETKKKCFEATAHKRANKRETIVIRNTIVQNWLRGLYIENIIDLNDYQEASEWALNWLSKNV